MELTVYRQASKTRPDGTVVYKGEDTLPYADSQLIMVADGLGGAAAIRHTSIDKGLFEPDTLPDVLFKGVYDDWSEPSFLEYVKNSFFELYAVKDCYTANVNNIKKSGYFASRIVSAIVLHEFAYNKGISAENFFSALSREKSQEKKSEVIAKMGKHFTDVIAEKLRSIAKNANIIYESSYAGLSLLGTTLCAALIDDKGAEAEVLLLTAGDSRPYVWNEKDGLCQLVKDEERADGGMTNYIKANDGESFVIKSSYAKFRKPCVIFCASDGCFDSGSFLSPMAFEKTILEAAAKSKSEKEMAAVLHDFFAENGRHDDSSTISMKFCGYANFDEFSRSAGRRLKAIEKEYISALPKLLTEDYISELERTSANESDLAAKIREAVGKEPTVINFCESFVKDEAEKLTGSDERIIKVSEQRTSAREGLTKLTSGFSEINDGSLSELEAAIGNVRTSDTEYSDIRSSIYSENLKKSAEKYWSENADKLIADITSGSGEYSPELVKAVKNTIEMVTAESDDLEKNAALQAELFEKYCTGYSKYMRGEEA